MDESFLLGAHSIVHKYCQLPSNLRVQTALYAVCISEVRAYS